MEDAVVERLREVGAMAKARLDSVPTYDIYQSVYAQLQYLIAVASGQEKNKSRLHEIIVGLYAVREFEESDPEFSVGLKDAQFIADRMAKGLKVSIHDLKR